MHSIKRFSRVQTVLAAALVLGISLLGFAYAIQKAYADIDPAGCSATGGSIILTTYRSDGTTPIGGGTVTDGELIKYKATLGALPSPVCAYQNGTWTLTTPDGVVHNITPGGGVPRIGGTGVASLDSALVSYTVIHANEIVGTSRHVDASTLYSGGISHKNTDDNLAGPTLGTSEQTVVVHTPVVATNVHNAAHGVITSAPIGSTVHDNATVTGESGGPAPTGNVAFNLYSGTACTGATTTQIVALSGNTESSGTVVAGGGLSYKAFYQGDSNYTPALGQCEPLDATKLTPTVTTDIHNAAHGVVTSVDVGTTVHDKATVTGSGPTPTGTVDFTWYTNGTCDAGATASGTDVALVAGVADPSSSQTPLVSGSYSFKAHYDGDATYNAADGQCEPLTVNKLTPTVVTDIHDAAHAVVTSVNAGTTVHDKATVSGSGATPTGTVDFTWYTNGTCSAGATASGTGVALVAGVADPSGTQTPASAGSYSFKAHYNGDGTYNAADGQCEPLTVNQLAIQGCSPGYWKQSQHFGSYPTPTAYPNTLFSAVGFDNAFPGKSLLQVLSTGGGGLTALGRIIVGAYLNASSVAGFPYTPAQVVADFNAVFPGTNAQYDALKAKYEALQDPCPLGRNPGPAGPVND